MPRSSQKSKAANIRQTKIQKLENKRSKSSEDLLESNSVVSRGSFLKKRPGKRFFILLVILGLLVLFYYNKRWFVAAMVDGKPITNLELQTEMNKLYRDKTLDKLVGDKIIEQIEREATSKGIDVTQEEIDKKLQEDEAQYGGKENFESLLTQQGIKKEDYIKYDIKIKLLSEKLYQNESRPTEEEIQKYMDQNKDAPEATEPAKFRKLIEDGLRSQKSNDLLGKRYQELKSKVVTF